MLICSMCTAFMNCLLLNLKVFQSDCMEFWMRNDLCKLIYLDTWSQFAGAVWGRLRNLVRLNLAGGKMFLWVDFENLYSCPAYNSFFVSCLQRCDLWVFSPCCHISLYPCHDTHLAFWIHMPEYPIFYLSSFSSWCFIKSAAK